MGVAPNSLSLDQQLLAEQRKTAEADAAMVGDYYVRATWIFRDFWCCTRCGALVYGAPESPVHRDLHDSWHAALAERMSA